MIKLATYDSVDLDRVSYSNGDLVADVTNGTIRLMNGSTPGGTKMATQNWVLANTLTTASLGSTLNNYAPLSSLSAFVTSQQLTAALAAYTPTGNTYTLPTASNVTLGGVKVDGTTITIDGNGVIHGTNQYTLPTASNVTLGGVKVDNSSITISNGVISATYSYSLPAAGTGTLGGVIVPAVGTSGLNNSSGTISLATATTSQLGGVKVDGSTVTISGGVISAPYTYTLPAATTSTLGGVIVPVTANSGLTNTSGTIRLATATTTQKGGVIVDGTTITITAQGVISAQLTGAITFQGGWSAATNFPTLANGSGTNGQEYIVTAAGTVNFGAGNVTFAVGDNVIYNGTTWIKIPVSSSAGVTNYTLTFDNLGAGAASGTTFNGSTAIDISYNTIGASPLAGSSSLTTTGTITSGVWNGTAITVPYGGTGVSTISGVLYGNGASAFTAATGTQIATALGTSAVAQATNVAGGTANQLLAQTAAGATGFVTAPTNNTYLTYTTSGGFAWQTIQGGGSVTSVSGTGTVNGLTLTGTVTTSGSLTLGGTLTGIANSALSNSTITFGSTAVSLGGTVSALNGVTIGTTTAAQVNATNFVTTTGNIYNIQPSPTALTATATLTIAQILTNIIQVTSTTAVTLTLPTGTLTDAGVLSGALPTNGSFDWAIINLGSSTGAITLAAGTSHTYVGSATVAIGSSAGFRTRKLAANSYTTYRIH